MGDNIYVSFWNSRIHEIINHFKSGETRFSIDVNGLNKFGNRESYYARIRIVKGELEVSRNGYAHARDFHQVLINTSYFKDNLSDAVISIIITKDFQMQIEMEKSTIPEFFTQKDFDMLGLYAGKVADRDDPKLGEAYTYLKGTYNKLEYWGERVCEKAFPDTGKIAITRKPTNQANKFERYQWIKIYPNDDLLQWKNLAYTLTFSNREQFCVKIDTVKLNDSDPIRKKYFDYRGDFFNSAIVKLLNAEEILRSDWNTLIEKSVDAVRQLRNDYEKLLDILGYEKGNASVPGMTKVIHPKVSLALNTILYGPPGTGKTHRLIQDYYPVFTSKKQEVSEEQYKVELVSKYTWWQVVAAAVLDLKSTHVTQILNHALVQIKDSVSDQKNARAMIWAMLQQHTKADCEFVRYSKRYEPLFFNKDKDGNWTIDSAIVDSEAPEVKELLESWRKPVPQNKEEIRRFEFITFHQSFSYEDFVEGIKPILEEEAADGDIRYKIEDGIFKRLCIKARRDPSNDYALFIDEINRGNVSQIFGELITLIEDDKREGKSNAIEVELPYSKKKFSVPPNVYIIGTMNTADRSVEALDTALRRRFSFTEMVPRYNIPELQKEVAGFTSSAILKKINDRLERLLGKDHLIGHSYFIDINGDSEKLLLAFQHKIIPLLQEYFYGDIGKIGLVLGKAFFENEPKEQAKTVFADFDHPGSELSSRRVYHLINLQDPVKMNIELFEQAIVELMK